VIGKEIFFVLEINFYCFMEVLSRLMEFISSSVLLYCRLPLNLIVFFLSEFILPLTPAHFCLSSVHLFLQH